MPLSSHVMEGIALMKDSPISVKILNEATAMVHRGHDITPALNHVFLGLRPELGGRDMLCLMAAHIHIIHYFREEVASWRRANQLKQESNTLTRQERAALEVRTVILNTTKHDYYMFCLDR